MSPFPPSLLEEFVCLEKGDKSTLVHKLGIISQEEQAPDVVLVDGSQLLYHVPWPSSGTVGDVAVNMSSCPARNYGQTCAKDIFVIFDNYSTELVAKDHERQRRGGMRQGDTISQQTHHFRPEMLCSKALKSKGSFLVSFQTLTLQLKTYFYQAKSKHFTA